MAEAYIRAAAGDAHGQGVASYADDGLLTRLPQVDEREETLGRNVPGVV